MVVLVANTEAAFSISGGVGRAPVAVPIPFSVEALRDELSLIHEYLHSVFEGLFQNPYAVFSGRFALTEMALHE